MRRRRFLAVTATLATLSGCAYGYQGRGPLAAAERSPGRPDGDRGIDSPKSARNQPGDLPIPKDRLRLAAPKDGIAAITEPAFAPDWSSVTIDRDGEVYEPRLNPQDTIIGVERAGEARAYPLKVLTWHEVVNDRFDGPLLVTYCPLCRSGMVARRTVDGQPTVFGVSGYLLHENLVMYDRLTGSLWSQLQAQAIRGPRTGEELELIPSTLTTWKGWRAANPHTRVLLPSPVSDTVVGEVHPPYGIDYYERLAETQEAFGFDGHNAGTLPDRMLVIGIEHNSAARAYPFPDVRTVGVVNGAVEELPVVVTVANSELVAYVRRVDGRTLAFEDDPFRAGDSRFDPVTGRAVSGPLAGVKLEPAPGASTMYWFAWQAFHPDTDVYRS